MKIAIIEKGHFEVAHTLVSLFDNGENELTIFIDESSCRQLSHLLQDRASRYTWIIQKDEPNRVFIRRLFAHLRQHSFDYIYFDTIADNFIHYAWYIRQLKKQRVILALHDINGYFHHAAPWHLRKTIRFAGKRWLIRLVPAFNVISETLIPLLTRKLPAGKTIYNIPGGFFEPAHFKEKKYGPGECIQLVVPGSVDTRRRDYEAVLAFLQMAQATGIHLSLTLLGPFRKGHSESIARQCRLYQQGNASLRFYETDDIPQAEFDRVMQEAHFIWMPLQEKAVVTDGSTEYYGSSISSGNVGDAIRFARPYFAPAHFQTDQALQESRYSYQTISDILDFLRKLDGQVYDRLQQSAHRASMHYTIDKIRERNQSLLFPPS